MAQNFRFLLSNMNDKEKLFGFGMKGAPATACHNISALKQPTWSHTLLSNSRRNQHTQKNSDNTYARKYLNINATYYYVWKMTAFINYIKSVTHCKFFIPCGIFKV
jgi:hypothetical protein